MTDIHCHILPGVDDGADDMGESLLMARLSGLSGVETIVATPHCNTPQGDRNFRTDELRDRFVELVRQLKDAGTKVSIFPGAEVFCTEETPELLRKGRLLTLAGSRYLLTEFYFDESLEFIDDMLAKLAAEGVTPVIAHPERYYELQRMPEHAAEWFRAGYVIQVNKDSLLGGLGRRAGNASRELLRMGLAHVVASDAHSSIERNTDMSRVQRLIEDEFSAEYARILLELNPKRILRDETLVPADGANRF